MAATVHITTKHNPIAIFLYATKINLTIDGTTEQVKWGTHSRELAPGAHQIDISFQYFGRPMGKSSTALDLADGSTTTIAYKAPQIVTSSGKVKVTAG